MIFSDPRGALSGVITNQNNGTPVVGATVSVQATDIVPSKWISTTTDATGSYAFSKLVQSASYQFNVAVLGITVATASIAVDSSALTFDYAVFVPVDVILYKTLCSSFVERVHIDALRHGDDFAHDDVHAGKTRYNAVQSQNELDYILFLVFATTNNQPHWKPPSHDDRVTEPFTKATMMID